jgi:hypothetical protein
MNGISFNVGRALWRDHSPSVFPFSLVGITREPTLLKVKHRMAFDGPIGVDNSPSSRGRLAAEFRAMVPGPLLCEHTAFRNVHDLFQGRHLADDLFLATSAPDVKDALINQFVKRIGHLNMLQGTITSDEGI